MTFTASADDDRTIGFVNYKANFPRADRIYVEAFNDPKVQNVTCYLSRAIIGGIKGMLPGVVEPSRVSVSCQKTGKIKVLEAIDETETGESVFTEMEGWSLKELIITRFVDRKRRVLIYLAWTTRPIDGEPYNVLSTIPVD